MNRSLAILGSLRRDGNTAKALNRLVCGLPCDIIDLQNQQIAEFSYAQDYEAGDQFIDIIKRIAESPVTILVTPVYWYSWSTPMKKFIDRFSDLLSSEKPLGRKLRGRRLVLLSTGGDPAPDETLKQAFQNFCDYLGMKNIGMVYACEDGPFLDKNCVENIRNLIMI